MTRTEFLEELRQALQGEVSQTVVSNNLLYYENYIMEEARKGRTEEEVIEELGNPRLLAKTIIDTSSNFRAREPYESYNKEPDSDDVNRNGTGRHYQKKVRSVKVAAWVTIGIIVLVLILLIGLVGSVISFIAPVLVPVLIILLLVGVFSRRK